MTNSIFLKYINLNQEQKSFQFHASIPFLWQEIYDLEFLETQENQFTEHINSRELNFSIPVEKAIENLKLKSQGFTHETERKKRLRLELIDFLSHHVKENTNLELDFTALLEFYHDSKKIYFDLKEFHLNKRKQLKYQKEKLSFRSIGYNDEFAAFSENYQYLIEETAVQKEINDSRHQAIIEKRNNPKNYNKTADYFFWLVFSIITFIIGILFYLIQLDFKYSLLLIIVSFISIIYWYFKFRKR